MKKIKAEFHVHTKYSHDSILGKYAIRAFNDYENKIRTGHSIDFKVQDIDLPQDVDCWK